MPVQDIQVLLGEEGLISRHELRQKMRSLLTALKVDRHRAVVHPEWNDARIDRHIQALCELAERVDAG